MTAPALSIDTGTFVSREQGRGRSDAFCGTVHRRPLTLRTAYDAWTLTRHAQGAASSMSGFFGSLRPRLASSNPTVKSASTGHSGHRLLGSTHPAAFLRSSELQSLPSGFDGSIRGNPSGVAGLKMPVTGRGLQPGVRQGPYRAGRPCRPPGQPLPQSRDQPTAATTTPHATRVLAATFAHAADGPRLRPRDDRSPGCRPRRRVVALSNTSRNPPVTKAETALEGPLTHEGAAGGGGGCRVPMVRRNSVLDRISELALRVVTHCRTPRARF